MSDEKTEYVSIDFNQCHKAIDTWIPSEREGYKLYAIEDLNQGPTDEYALVQYSWTNEAGTILQMGQVNIAVEALDREATTKVFEENNLTTFTDEQWRVVTEAYKTLSERVLRDAIFDGVPQLYNGAVYHEIPKFKEAMHQYIDDIHSKIEKCEKYAENEDKKNYYEDYAEYTRLGDDQYHHIDLLEEAITWEHEETVPYARHCQLAAVLEFDTYEDWEIRALENIHNGVFVNKPELAKTKALLNKDLTQKDIAEKLNKDPSTVSRQASAVESWERRADWQMQN